jgi:hypothetical protein
MRLRWRVSGRAWRKANLAVNVSGLDTVVNRGGRVLGILHSLEQGRHDKASLQQECIEAKDPVSIPESLQTETYPGRLWKYYSMAADGLCRQSKGYGARKAPTGKETVNMKTSVVQDEGAGTGIMNDMTGAEVVSGILFVIESEIIAKAPETEPRRPIVEDHLQLSMLRLRILHCQQKTGDQALLQLHRQTRDQDVGLLQLRHCQAHLHTLQTLKAQLRLQRFDLDMLHAVLVIWIRNLSSTALNENYRRLDRLPSPSLLLLLLQRLP